MKICIYGAGAIGGYLAAGLSEVDGVELSLVARGPHLAAIQAERPEAADRRRGRASAGRRRPTIRAELGPQDYVIVCLKAHQAWEAADQMAPLLGPDTAVVTGQNGVPWWYTHGLDARFDDARLQQRRSRQDRQWTAIGPRAGDRLRRLSGHRDRRARAWCDTSTATSSRSASRTAASRRAACACPRVLRGGRLRGAGPEGHPQRDLAQAVGQPVLQPDQRADARDARHRGDRAEPARAVDPHDGRGAGDRHALRRHLPRRHRRAASTAPPASARTAPRCCRTWRTAARSRSTRCSPLCRKWAGWSVSRRPISTWCSGWCSNSADRLTSIRRFPAALAGAAQVPSRRTPCQARRAPHAAETRGRHGSHRLPRPRHDRPLGRADEAGLRARVDRAWRKARTIRWCSGWPARASPSPTRCRSAAST